MDPENVPTKFEVSSFTRSWKNRGYFKTLRSPWIGRSRSSKVTDFGTNWKRVCDFLLVRNRNRNLGPILYRLGDIAGFCAPEWPHPYSTLITARCTIVHSAVLRLHVVCLSVCLSVTLVDQDHTGQKSRKLIARTLSPTPSLFGAQRISTYSQGNMEKFWGD